MLYDTLHVTVNSKPLSQFKGAKILFLDFETIPDTHTPVLVGIGAGCGVDVFDIADIDKQEFFNLLDTVELVVAHNIEFELTVLKNMGYCPTRLYGRIGDTMAMLHVLNTENPLGLKDAAALVGMKLNEWDALLAMDKDKYAEYCKDDVRCCMALFSHLYPQVKQEGCNCAYELELAVTFSTMQMRETGVLIDADKIRELSSRASEQMDKLTEELVITCGKVIDFNSNKALPQLLYREMGVPEKPEYRTPKGALSTAEDVLKSIVNDPETPPKAVEFCEKLLSYRETAKFISTYVSEAFLAKRKADGRIHARFFGMGTTTSRYSTASPSLQNIPKQGPNVEIRRAYVAPVGYKLVRLDLSQAEYRFLAHYSQDPDLVKAYHEGKDIHTATGELLGIKDRAHAKQMSFAAVYGLSIANLGKRLNIPYEKAAVLYRAYFDRFPKIRNLRERMVAFAKGNKYTKLLSGRIRKLDKYEFVDNISINTPIQGAVAEYIKLCMVMAYKEFYGKPIRLVMQIHDELVFECRDDYVGYCAAEARKIMESAHMLSVPMLADVTISQSWLESKDDV